MSESKDRDFCLVMAQLIEVVPEGEKEIHKEFNRLLYDASYLAPEIRSSMFGVAVNTLNRLLPFPPKTDWQWKVAAIFADRTDDFKVYRAEVLANFS